MTTGQLLDTMMVDLNTLFRNASIYRLDDTAQYGVTIYVSDQYLTDSLSENPLASVIRTLILENAYNAEPS